MRDSKEENTNWGDGSRATTSSVGSKAMGVLTTIYEQQQRQASSGPRFWSDGTPEISHVMSELTSQAINSTAVRRRMITAAKRKSVMRDGMP